MSLKRSHEEGSSIVVKSAKTGHLKNVEEGHIIYSTGDIIHPKDSQYTILEEFGNGKTSKVLKVEDKKDGRIYAMKIIIANSLHREGAKQEINILNHHGKKDPERKSSVLPLLTHFDYDGHTCLLFDPLGLTLAKLIDQKDESFTLEQIRSIAYQMCTAVKFMHDNKLTHADLKPENILFCDPNIKSKKDVHNSSIRLIDLGLATFDSEPHLPIVGSRFYRAPEMIMELGWSHPIDVWSLGCILFEMYTGRILFYTTDDHEHLAMMQQILASFPFSMTRVKKQQKTKYFTKQQLDKSPTVREDYVKALKPLEECMKDETEETQELFDLLRNMLRLDPERRIAIGEAIKHSFFEKSKDKSDNVLEESSSIGVNTDTTEAL